MITMLTTGIKLPRNDEEIKIGDILKSNATYDVVVMWHKEKNVPIVKVMNNDDNDLYDNIWFTLEEFVQAWTSRLEVDGNINIL